MSFLSNFISPLSVTLLRLITSTSSLGDNWSERVLIQHHWDWLYRHDVHTAWNSLLSNSGNTSVEMLNTKGKNISGGWSNQRWREDSGADGGGGGRNVGKEKPFSKELEKKKLPLSSIIYHVSAIEYVVATFVWTGAYEVSAVDCFIYQVLISLPSTRVSTDSNEENSCRFSIYSYQFLYKAGESETISYVH